MLHFDENRWMEFLRSTILGLVANEQPLAETIEDLISTARPALTA
jgi:hypothetical protein